MYSDTDGVRDFTSEVLKAHNVYRHKHNSPSLKVSAEATKKAQSWADNLARSGECKQLV